MAVAIGIDLGTTNSVAAVVTPTGVKLAAEDGGPIHPSVVGFSTDGSVVVGQKAKPLRATEPTTTVFSAKRLIGQNVRAPLVQLAMSTLPFAVEEGHNHQPVIAVNGRRLTIPEVSALVLGHLKRMAEVQFGDEVNQAVITVPANFSDAQRQATREAGLIAGLEVLRLVNEPTAAALAYGHGKRLDETIAVFDFGGGTFDVSLLKIRSDIFEVLATDGDMFLGGDDLDRAVAEYLAAEMARTTHVDPRPHVEAMTRLRMAAEQIKAYLSEEGEASGEIDGIVIAGRDVPMRLPFEIRRSTFESMISGYVDKTIELCRHVLTAAKLEPRSIADVVLVGGSTRIPLVRRMVAELFGKEPRTDINPDEVVAHGAAVQAAMLSGERAAVPAGSAAVSSSSDDVEIDLELAPEPARPARALLLDVTPAALSIATVGGYADRLLERNSPIPIERTRSFTTSRDAQTKVVIEVCRGEARRFEDNEPLGSLELDAIAPAPRGVVEIEVTFRIDADGILDIRARDVRTNQAQQARLNVIGAPTRPGPGQDRPASPKDAA